MEYATLNLTASQQLVLRASPVALAFSAARGPQATAVRAKKPEEVEKEARARVVSEGGDPGNATLVLSRHSIQFGKYQGQTFKWLLENDAGYAIQLVHSHQRERETNTMTSPLMANKDALAQYSCAHQVFISHLKFHRAHEEARARASQPGREGEALVGFGQFKGDTLKDLYESTDKDRQGFVKWLKRKTPQPGTAMDAARKYILRRDAERPAATAAGSSSSSSSSSSTTTTTAGAASFPPFPTSSTSTAAPRGSVAPAVSALLGRRPMGPGELQAKPTIPESWRTTLSREQQEWVGRALFTIDSRGKTSLTTDLNLWWDPPQPRPTFAQPPASPAAFFACRLFLWMPVRIWGVRPACAQPGCNRPFTKAGLYKTIRRVLDIDGWYLMATEYLECRRCQRKVAGWSQEVMEQLEPGHRCQFPALLTYQLSCDRRVISMLRERTRGNSATQLYKKLCEVHSETWMRRSTHYLSVMEPFLTSGVVRACTPPPSMPPVPQPGWLLTVYGHDILSRLEDVKARVTSIFGKVLKMDSTKKVTRKLAGAAAGTAAWVTNVGNEHGQVLMSVLTAGLLPMAAGIVRRYRDAGVEPPQLLYVDRDCCSSFGGSRAAAMFAEWEGLVVRLDIWHLMRRFASGVTTESHQLYKPFLQQLSSAIFTWHEEDAARLLDAKKRTLMAQGMSFPSDAGVWRHVSRKEMALHCRRRTRGAAETERLIGDLLEIFGGDWGRDTMGIPLLDRDRIQAIWAEQKRHLRCIQDPPGVELYTETGRLTKGGISLPVYRCARGSTSLESFHLHLNLFIPGDSASDHHFQGFLLEGLARWNEDRAASMAEGGRNLLRSYSGPLQHSLDQLSQRVLGESLVKDYTRPREYTGELIGIEYLYSQTGRVLQDISLDPDTPDAEGNVPLSPPTEEGLHVAQEEVDDLTIPPPGGLQRAPPQRDPRSGQPADDAPAPEPPRPTTPEPAPHLPGRSSPPPQPAPEDYRGPDEQPGYLAVVKLATALVGLRSEAALSERRVDELIELYEALSPYDRARVHYPPRHRDRPAQGRFKAAKSAHTSIAGVESLKRCLVGQTSGPATWPSASRVVEAVCTQLCNLYPSGTRVYGSRRTRWDCILLHYRHIRDLVLGHQRLMARAPIQLFELNQRTLSQWYVKWTNLILVAAGTSAVAGTGPATAVERPPAVEVVYRLIRPQVATAAPAGPSTPLPAAAAAGPFGATQLLDLYAPRQRVMVLLPPPPPLPIVPQTFAAPQLLSTAAQLLPPPSAARPAAAQAGPVAAAARPGPPGVPRQKKRESGGTGGHVCGLCGQPRRKETGHSRYRSDTFCAVTAGRSVEDWLREMREKYRS
ncbi:hypothetical protein ACEWY4_024495 [Coilia grayii]|uniref:DUF6729 domain-containing protein n=1 Tax=Coilia grayii TaxID=363190 RepID=A0ABD1J0I3_9TELE